MSAATTSDRRVIIDGRRVTLGKQHVLGSGGEAMVFADPDEPADAVKVYHDPAGRGPKLEALIGGKVPFPSRSTAPKKLVLDASTQEIVGFTMRRLNGSYQPVKSAFKPSFCRAFDFTGPVRARILREMGADLVEIHAGGRVVGDLNASNLMVNETRRDHTWVDVDSMQVGRFPCPVGQALYIHPSLYGQDLSKKPMFKPEHDVWSLSLIACQLMLHGVHPFKSGEHPKALSSMDRANQRLTVFDAGVSYPKIGLPPEVLTDDLLHELHQILVGASRGKFPVQLLEACERSLAECPSCQTWYPAVRGRCPVCSHVATVPVRIDQIIADLMFETTGSIVALDVSEGGVIGLANDGGSYVVFRRESGRHGPADRIQTRLGAVPGARVEILGRKHLVMAPKPEEETPELYILEIGPAGLRPVKSVSTAVFSGGKAVFGCSHGFLYRIAGRSLICGELSGDALLERPVMDVFEGQTWFRVAKISGGEALVGFHREFDRYRWFLVTGDGRRFERHVVTLEFDQGESLTAYAVHFDGGAALIVRRTKVKGVERIRVDVVSLKDGKSLASRVEDALAAPQWDEIYGCAFDGVTVLHPTDAGIVPERLVGAAGKPAAIPGTDVHVSADCALFPHGRGCVVATPTRVSFVEPK